MDIVPATPNDLSAIIRLHTVCVEDSYEECLGTSTLKPLSDEEITTLIPQTILAKTTDEMIVGKIHWHTLWDDAVLIGGLAVVPTARGHGLSLRLLQSVISSLAKGIYRSLYAITAKHDVVHIFETCGFVVGSSLNVHEAELLVSAQSRYAVSARHIVHLMIFSIDK